MPYEERLLNASYTSPSGTVSSFDFEVLTRDINHRIGTFEFSGVNGTLHQDKGVSGEIYPLTIYIHGPDYDLEADRFLELTKETGPGFLNHPRWGRKRVQILSITQSENLIDAGGQAVFTVQFQETLEREFPNTGNAAQQQVPDLADNYQTEAIDNYVDQVDAEDLADELSLEQDITLSANAVSDALSSITSSDQDIARKFRGYIDNILNNANDYVQQPFDYAFQITSAIRVVAEVPGRISAKLNGYKNLFSVLQFKDIGNAITQNKNSLLIDELLATCGIVSASESINQALSQTSTISRDSKGKATISVAEADDGFQTRDEVLSAVIFLEDNSNDIINYLDDGQVVFEENILSESYIQSVNSYVPTWEVVAAVIKAGLDLSFSLPVKRQKILLKSHSILDLCYEFYKNTSDIVLDYFILTNMLSGEEIIEVPKGKEIIYYE